MNMFKQHIVCSNLFKSCLSYASLRPLSTKTTVKTDVPLTKVEKPPLCGTPTSPACFGQTTHHTHPHIQLEGEVIPGFRTEEFRARRFRLMDRIVEYGLRSQEKIKSHLVVIPSSQKKYMTEKIPYVFRQNSDFLYLCGCMEPDSVLVLTSDGLSDHVSTLFLRGKDAHSELWDGPRTGVDQAPLFFGVDKSLPFSEFEHFLSSFLKQNTKFALWYDFLHDVNVVVHRIMKEMLTNMHNKVWESPKPFIQRLRLYKSPAEQQLMRQSCMIGCEAISETIKHSQPGQSEAQLFARVDFESRMRGAEYLAYPPVIAGGPRANIIHYIDNNQVINDGDMVLMDAGCEYHSYSSDITRTWPISGKFTPAQRRLYEAVYLVQIELIKLCSTFPTLDILFHKMCRLLGQQLLELGMFGKNRMSQEELARAAYTFCPHHCSHYLGMDVHDTGLIPRSIPVEPGMIITVEPGIYVNSNNKLSNPEYHGMGIRIEDDILITESGPVVLTNCPKHPDEIERLASWRDVK